MNNYHIMVKSVNAEIIISPFHIRRWNKTFLHCNLNINCQGKVNKMKKDMGKDLNNKMFCFQCEQTAGCAGCMGAAGVCGKTANT